MKTLRLALICAFIAIATVNYANAGRFNVKASRQVIDMTLVQAIQDPGIVAAMLQQLNNSFLKNNQQSYAVSVSYQNYDLLITGTYEQWALFFRNHWTEEVKIHPASINEL